MIFFINGKKIGSATTNEFGIARLPYTFYEVGKYVLTVKFNGDEDYFPSMNQTVMNIVKPPNPNPENNTNLTDNNNKTNISAKMLDTGIPLILIIFICVIIGVIPFKKKK